MPYVFDAEQAGTMAEAGADLLVAHVGLTASGSIGAAAAMTLAEAMAKVIEIAGAGRQVRDDILVICHGGAFDEPPNVGQRLADVLGIAGFFGVSSIERLPTERAITGQVEPFKVLKLA